MLLVLAAPAQAAFPGANGKIAFEDYEPGRIEISVVSPDGTGYEKLTHSDPAVGNVNPSWSPDGSRIAYASNIEDRGYDLFVMSASGTGLTNVTNSQAFEANPAWSPDGRRLAFQGGVLDPFNVDIYAINVDGTGLQRLTDSPGADERPAWSPDGMKIAFESNRDIFNLDLFVMNADGSDETNITNTRQQFLNEQFANWSPDGKRIVFQKGILSDTHVYTVKPDGTELTLVSDRIGYEPAWSPDGQRIAFGRTVEVTALAEIFHMAVDGSDERYVGVDPQDFEVNFDWQPLNRPTDCSGVRATPEVLRPANHKFVKVSIAGAEDQDGDPVTLTVDGVTQDEPVRAKQDTTAPDARRVPRSDRVKLRAERSSKGDGRVYRIAFTASDGKGGSCSGTAKVSVPRHRHRPAVDSAPPSFDSFGS